MKLDVFRDKIRPGGVEEWRLTVRNAEGGCRCGGVGIALRFLARPDRSISPMDIESVAPPYCKSCNSTATRQVVRPAGIQGYALLPFRDVDPLAFDRLNWFDFSLGSSGRMMVRGCRKWEMYRWRPMVSWWQRVMSVGRMAPERHRLRSRSVAISTKRHSSSRN